MKRLTLLLVMPDIGFLEPLLRRRGRLGSFLMHLWSGEKSRRKQQAWVGEMLSDILGYR